MKINKFQQKYSIIFRKYMPKLSVKIDYLLIRFYNLNTKCQSNTLNTLLKLCQCCRFI